MSYFDDCEGGYTRPKFYSRNTPMHKAMVVHVPGNREPIKTLCGIEIPQSRCVQKVTKVTCKECLKKL